MRSIAGDADLEEIDVGGRGYKESKAVLMKKSVIRPVVLVLVFMLALIVFSFLTNKVNEDLTTTMSEATIPVMKFYRGDTMINELHGYSKEMNATAMRDSIIPVASDRKLPIEINTYGTAVDTISYQIRSMDTKRLVAETEITDFQIKNNKMKAEVTVQNLLEDNEEYLMIFNLSSDNKNYYYYTRIMRDVDCGVDECMKFAKKFHSYTFKDNPASFLATYLDPATGDATTLNYVDLSCTLKQITWADFEGKVLTDPVLSFKEINETYNVITLTYVMSYVEDNGQTEYYNIEEYYRLKNASERMYVLNFERRMNQIFRGENDFFTDTKDIQLGIRDENVDYQTNEAGDVICFVQEGELWCYDVVNKDISQVFSFRNVEGIGERENWDQHDIKIVRIDEAGSVDFIVYGYMNRGDHEGEVGTGVYHYDGLAHTVEEEAFIPSDKSFEILKAEMGKLMYENEADTIYLMLEGNVYSINLNNLKVKVEIEGLKEGCYATSESMKYFAWIEPEEKNSSTTLYLKNLKTGNVKKIVEGEDKYLRPLGFIDNDFIYGIARAKDVLVDAAGNTTFAMKSMKIMNTSEDDSAILKEYKPSNRYIESISIEDYTINVNLVKKSNGQYVNAKDDTIMNRAADTEEKVMIAKTATDIKETQIQLDITVKNDVKQAKLITSKGVILENPRIVELDSNKDSERFYVYVKGDVLLATDSISEAISCANAKMGIVIDKTQQYVWMKARKNYANPFSGIKVNSTDGGASSAVKCVSAMLEYKGVGIGVSELVDAGATPKSILKSELKDSVVLDLKGCKIEDIVFYVSKGSPVLAMTSSKNAVLVIGYSLNNIYYFDPSSGKTKTVGFKDAEKMFYRGGNKFLTYLDR